MIVHCLFSVYDFLVTTWVAAESPPLPPASIGRLRGFGSLALPPEDVVLVDRGDRAGPRVVAVRLDVQVAAQGHARRDRQVVAEQRERVTPVQAGRSGVPLVLTDLGDLDRVEDVVAALGRSRCTRGDGDAGREASGHRQREETSLDAAAEASPRLGVLHFTLRSVLETNR